MLPFATNKLPVRSFFNNTKVAEKADPKPVEAAVPQLSGAELSAVYYSHRIGGDFYDFSRVSSDRVLFGLLDIAGRAEDNRDIVTAAQKTFRAEGAKLFSQQDVNEADAMIQLCLRLNRTIIDMSDGQVRSSPAFAGCYNETLGTICYFNAGHTPGVVRHCDSISELEATGLPLGLFSHATCDAPTIGLERGAALILISKGLLEGRYRNEEFGMDRLKATIETNKSASARDLCLSAINAVQQFMRTPPVHNDVTALALLRHPES